MSTHPSRTSDAAPGSGRLGSYLIGYALSVVLTLLAFWMARFGASAAAVIVLLALLQLLVQLVYFLHIGKEKGSGWNVGLLLLTGVILFILVGGTLWIMTNLAHLHMQEPTTTDLYQNGVVAPQNELK